MTYVRTEKEQENTSVFRLIDLSKLYSDRLNELGVVLEHRVNITHLHEKIFWPVH